MKTILVVEDDGALQQLYKEFLGGEGYAVEMAVSVAEGLAKTRELSPQLILLDIMLPGGMNGFDLLEQLKADERFKHIPVIVLTNLDAEKESALKIGAEDYIVKANTSLEELGAKVKKHIL